MTSLAKRNRLNELKEIVEENIAAFKKLAIALAEIRAEKLWQLDGYDSFQAFCKGEFNFGQSYGYELAQAADVLTALQNSGMPESELPTSSGHTRELAKAPTPAEQREAWELALKTGDGQPTRETVRTAVEQVTQPAPSPIPARVRDTQQKATPGSTAVVVDGPQHIGAEVKVTKVEANGGLIHAETPSGQVHPFLAGEIEITEQADPPQPKPTPKQIIEQLRALLERVLKEELTDELVAEIQAALA